MLRRTLKPSDTVGANWSSVFTEPGLAVAAAALVQCLVLLGDSFELLLEVRDLRDVSGATVKLVSVMPFLTRERRGGSKYRVSEAFLQDAAMVVPEKEREVA